MEGCLTEAIGDDNDTDPGFDGMILLVYMAEGSPWQIGTAHSCVRSAWHTGTASLWFM